MWVKRIFLSLVSGILFGLIIPTWATFKTFSLTILILSGLIIASMSLRDFHITRNLRLEWSRMRQAEEQEVLQGDKPEGR